MTAEVISFWDTRGIEGIQPSSREVNATIEPLGRGAWPELLEINPVGVPTPSERRCLAGAIATGSVWLFLANRLTREGNRKRYRLVRTVEQSDGTCTWTARRAFV